MRGVQSFARRQPTAFLGLAVLAGFGVVRFLKSSGPMGISRPAVPRQTRARRLDATEWGYRDEFTK